MRVKAIMMVVLIFVVSSVFAGAGENEAPSLYEGKININTASVEEFTRLPTIGSDEAAGTIEYRSANGPFKATDDLLKAEGIRRMEYDLIEKYLAVEGETTLER